MRLLLCAVVLLAACDQPASPPAATPPPSAASTNWDAQLLTLMPQINTCIAASPQTRTITYAGPDNAGALIIRMGGVNGGVDCHMADGAARISPRDEALVIEGENAAIFVRAPGENPGGECYEAPEVRDDNGVLLGWLLDPEGC